MQKGGFCGFSSSGFGSSGFSSSGFGSSGFGSNDFKFDGERTLPSPSVLQFTVSNSSHASDRVAVPFEYNDRVTKPFEFKLETSTQPLTSPSVSFISSHDDRPRNYLSNDHGVYSDATLVVAAYQGNIELVKSAVVKEKTNAKCLEAALIVAAEKGHYEIVSFLLEGGINPNLRNRANQPLLYRAAFFGYATIVRALLDAGADPLVEVQMDGGCFPSSYHSPSYAITISIECNHFEVYTGMMTYMYAHKQLDRSLVTKIVYLLMKNKYPNETRRILQSDLEIDSNNGLSVYALDESITNNFLDIAQTLLEKGVTIKNILGGRYGALAKVIENANIPSLKFMIERGASLTETYSDGVSPLVLAVKSGSIEVVKILLAEKVAVNTPFISRVFRDSDFEIYETALTFAIRKGHTEIAKLLIDVGGELPPPPKRKERSTMLLTY